MTQSTAELSTDPRQAGSDAAPALDIDASTAEIQRIFKLQQSHQYTVAKTTARARKAKLKRLEAAFLAHREDIRAALFADFRKHPSEVDLTEVFPVTSEIKHGRRHLSKWMRPHRVTTPMALLGARSYIHYEFAHAVAHVGDAAATRRAVDAIVEQWPSSADSWSRTRR